MLCVHKHFVFSQNVFLFCLHRYKVILKKNYDNTHFVECCFPLLKIVENMFVYNKKLEYLTYQF